MRGKIIFRIFFYFALILSFIPSASILSQDFLMQAWYWDYPKPGCNTASTDNWAVVLENQAADLKAAGFTYLWLPPLSRASYGNCSNGYDPKDLYDLGEYGLGRTGFGTRTELNQLVASLNTNGIKAVADMVYNHRDGGAAENNTAVEGWIENYNSIKHSAGDNAYPSDRFRCVLPIGGATGRGNGTYYFKVKSASEHSDYFGKKYKVYMWTDVVGWQNLSDDESEGEPNGGGGCGESSKTISLGRNYWAWIDGAGCKVDEFALTLDASDYNSAGDNIYIVLANDGGYSDHYIYELWYNSANIQGALLYQTYTNFNGLPSGSGGMNYMNFKPNGNPTQLSGDWDWPWFFYDYDQDVSDTKDKLFAWTEWLWDNVGIRGLRMDAVKHFPPSFVGDLLDYLHITGIDPGLVVGEFYDGNSGTLKGWVDQVYTHMEQASKDNIIPRVFDFSLRSALKDACDWSGYDVRNIFNSSVVDATGLSGYNVVTFVSNHDFRESNQYINNDPILAYAYILTNNQIGLPCVFYPDYYSVTGYPTAGMKSQIDALISTHKSFIAGLSEKDYLSRDGTPYDPYYVPGSSEKVLVYQLMDAPLGEDVIVAINFGYTAADMWIGINRTGGRVTDGVTTFGDRIGNAASPILEVSDGDFPGRVNIQLPARSYAVWVEGESPVPIELVSFTGVAENSNVMLNWKTATEVNNYGFEVERSLTPTPSQREGAFNWQLIGFLNGSGNSNSPKEYSFKDENLEPGFYTYRLKQIDNDGQFEYSNSVFVEIKNNSFEFTLDQNYPNPFNPSTKISWQSPVSSRQVLKVFDILGNEVVTLVDEYKTAGSYEVEFQSTVGGKQLTSGIYYYELRAGSFVQSKKMVLIK